MEHQTITRLTLGHACGAPMSGLAHVPSTDFVEASAQKRFLLFPPPLAGPT